MQIQILDKPYDVKKLRLYAVATAGVLLAVILVLIVLQAAASHAPAFYVAALAADHERARESSDAMLENATAIFNTSQRAGPWYAVVTEEQINGWLAVDLVDNYPDLLPSSIDSPRVHLEPGQAMLACGYTRSGVSTIVSVNLDMYLVEPHVVALRIRSARAGALPMPIKPIIDWVVTTAERLELQIAWRQADGDPVALITLPNKQSQKASYILDSLQLRGGEVYLAGRTNLHQLPSSPESSPPPVNQPDVASLPDESRKTQ